MKRRILLDVLSAVIVFLLAYTIGARSATNVYLTTYQARCARAERDRRTAHHA